jgi:hypothetical protein
LPRDGGRIVKNIVDGVGIHIKRLGQDVELGDGGREFEVAVGDRPPRVDSGYQVRGHGSGPCLTPQKGLEGTVGQGHEVNAAGALFGSIAGAWGGRDSIGGKFINDSWTTSHVFHEPVEVVEEGMGVGVESHSIAVARLQCIL